VAAWGNHSSSQSGAGAGFQRSPADTLQLAWAIMSTATPPIADRYLVVGYDGSALARRALDAA
jgi:hypothetical protein